MKDPFHRGLLRSVRGTDGKTALHSRGSFASGPRFLFITTYVIDSVESRPRKANVNYLLVLLYKDTPGVLFLFYLIN
jgi:hypothetical protein